MNPITLISGRVIYDNDILFDRDYYHFYWTKSPNPGPGGKGEDITNDIFRRDKFVLVPSFDVEKDNLRLSSEQGSYAGRGADPLSESTFVIGMGQLITNPLEAPLAALDTGVKQVLGSFTTKLVIGLGIAYALYLWSEKKK